MLPPSQLTPESAPAVRLHVLVPAQLPVELLPRFWVQVLIAVHEVSQPEPQVPVQVVEFAQCEVQFAPQETVQVLFFWQSKVMSLGNPASGSTAPPSLELAAPRAHTAPDAQVQVVPLHWQVPEHATAGTADWQPANERVISRSGSRMGPT